MKKQILKLLLVLSLGAMAQQQTFEFFKWNEVPHPLPNWRNRGQNTIDPTRTDSQGRLWNASTTTTSIVWTNNKDSQTLTVPFSPQARKSFSYSSNYYNWVESNDTKIAHISASKYVNSKYYYDWYFAKTNTTGQTEYLHPTDFGILDSSRSISNFSSIGNKLLIRLSSNDHIWQGDPTAVLPKSYSVMYSDKKNTTFLVYTDGSGLIYSFNADGSFQKRLGTELARNYSFEPSTGVLTVATYSNKIYTLKENADQLVNIPSGEQLLRSQTTVPLPLSQGPYKAQVILTQKGFNVQEGKNNISFLFSQTIGTRLDSLELGSYTNANCARLQPDSSIVFVYRKTTGSQVLNYYVFVYKKGTVHLQAILDASSYNLSAKIDFVNIVAGGHSYLYLQSYTGNTRTILQFKDDKAAVIPYTSPNCSLYIMDWTVDKDYLWLSNEAPDNSPCAMARMRHDDYFIEGSVYYDMNANGIRDASELPYNQLKLTVKPSGLVLIPDQKGRFVFKGRAGDTYSVRVLDSTRFISILTNAQGHIGVKLKEENPEVNAFFFLPRARCFTNRPANVTLQNIGVVPAEKVIIRLHAKGMKLSQDEILVDTAVFTYQAIAAGQTLYTTYNIQWPEASQVGQTATLYTRTEMYLNGVIAAVKYDSVQTIIRCSYDPNDKAVSPVGRGDEAYTLKKNTLQYLIRFENTGNDTAYHIVVRDTLSPNLDWNSIASVNASHRVNTEISESGVLSFHFNYIMLPDTGTNKEKAQGYVSFSIKPKGTVNDNTLLCNTAAIYFDENPPIITNKACNTLVETLPIVSGIQESSFENVAYIYPNPTKDWIGLGNDVKILRIYNQQGETLIQSSEKNINLSQLTNGLYMVQIQLHNGSVATEKLVIVK